MPLSKYLILNKHLYQTPLISCLAATPNSSTLITALHLSIYKYVFFQFIVV